MNQLADILRGALQPVGAISFARFMELALYHPELGYYERDQQRVGRRGDFYTSVSVGEVFGQLLAAQISDWLAESPSAGNGPSQILEAGAHDGKLAADLLRFWETHHPALYERIEYVLLEPSARRQAWQAETLREFAPRVRWAADWSTLSAGGINGVMLSNELLDAFPVHRIGWDTRERHWFEWGVTWKNDQFTWIRLPERSAAIKFSATWQFLNELPPALLDILPDGFTTELCPAAEDWWSKAAQTLRNGRLLTVDYGLEAHEFLSPGRAQGTLRAYRQHRLNDQVLADPGEQDLTAHVHFSALQQRGEAAGLRTETFGPQAQFLAGIAARLAKGDGQFPEWTPARVRQFQTLTHPEHLGRSFRVLVQQRTA